MVGDLDACLPLLMKRLIIEIFFCMEDPLLLTLHSLACLPLVSVQEKEDHKLYAENVRRKMGE